MKKKVRSMAAFMLACAIIIGAPAVPAQAKSKGYAFSWNGVSVGMHDKAKKFISKAGRPVAKKVKKSCAYKGKDRIYKYKDFILYTYSKTDKGEEYVNGITFLNGNVSTEEKIRIGSPLADVAKKYKNGKEKFGIYTFKKAKSKLQIEVTDGKVTNIRYIGTK